MRPVSKQITPPLTEEEELICELHDLLRSYAPLWYTKDMDTRLRKCIGKFTQPSKRTKHSALPTRAIRR